MSFAIEIEDLVRYEENAPFARGRIVMGDFEESFEAPVHHWTANDYRRQWKEALGRIAAGIDSALITTAYNGNEGWCGFWWILFYRVDHVLVHAGMIVPGETFLNFTVQDPYAALPEYRRTSEDGDLVSEWTVPTEDLIAFGELMVVE
jgi:hypothetical protein